MTTYTEKTVGELVAEKPGRARVFEKFGIDYCCGGKMSLADACKRKSADQEQIERALALADASPLNASDEVDWLNASMSDLVDNIVNTHHAWLKSELPRLRDIVNKVAQVHGSNRPELKKVAEVFDGLLEELMSHMMKEEYILFPWIKSVDAGSAQPIHCGTVMGPISVMEHEHDNAGQALEQLRQLTDGYNPPADACNTYRVMLSTLSELESDLHTHIHKENNILFPKAMQAEREIMAGAAL